MAGNSNPHPKPTPAPHIIDEDVTLTQICRDAQDLIAARSWGPKTPAERMLYLTAELGEVADAVLELTGLRPSSHPTAEAAGEAVASEIYDTIWNLCDLANILGLDLNDAARRKKAGNDTRVWGPTSPSDGLA